ncbi:MAG: hypothetical protein ACT4PE_05775 [Candidatus Eiseniibacteriota bacterium]
MTQGGRRLKTAAARLSTHQVTRVLLAAAARAFGLAVAWLAVLVIADRIVPLPAAVRAAGFALTVALPAVLFGRALLRLLPALRDLEAAARRTEVESADLRERLVPALQVLDVRDDGRTGYSTDLVDAFVDDTAAIAERVRPATLPYNARLRRGAAIAAAGTATALLAALALGPQRAGHSVLRLAGSFAELGPGPAATFIVVPGDVSIPRGTNVTLAAVVEHARLAGGEAEAVLEWRTNEQAPWTEVKLEGEREREDGARFRHRFSDVRESFRYRFAHAGRRSAEHSVEAVPHPSLMIEEVRYRYPEYTGLPVRSVRDGAGDLAAVKGTVAELSVRCTNEVRAAWLALDSGTRLELARVDDGPLRAEVPILAQDAYRLHVEDTLGLVNLNPLTYGIRALADEAPFIRLIEPGEDSDLDESLRVGLRFSAVDDFGLGPVQLVFEASRRPGETQRLRIFTPPSRVTDVSERFEWSLASLDLLPGDTVVYRLEVTDTNAVDGPSTARTRDYVLRFPTLGEIYAEIDEEQETSLEELKEVAEQAERVEKQVEEISREILKQGESSWENRKEVERALAAQEQLAEELERVQEEIESNLGELAESEFATLEAVQKMEQIRKLLDEVATDEMKEALEKLREALEQANPRRMQEDLAEFQMSQEELREQLDRILENLKQFRLEENFKAAVRQLEELAAKQERVNEELAREDASDDERKDADENRTGEEESGEETGEEADEKDGSESEDEGAEKESAGEKSGEQEAADQETAEKEGAEEGAEESASEQKSPSEKRGPSEKRDPMENLAEQEKALAEETRAFEKKLREIAEMTQELRDSNDQEMMQGLSEKMESSEIPETMDDAAKEMSQGNSPEAQEKGEDALTKLERMLTQLSSGQQQMAMRMAQINQAAINRAVRDLLSVSGDEERLAKNLEEMPRNTNSATRTFADEQHLLIQGTERVEEMLEEVAKDTPLMGSAVGERLKGGIRAMKEAAHGLENGAVQVARDDGDQAVEDLNAVIIALLETASSMSSCASGMPMSGFMQQLQEMTGDQQKLNEALKEMLKNGSGQDRRLDGRMRSLAAEQQRLKDELQRLLDEAGSGKDLLGRLDQVTEKLDEVAKRLREGRLDEETLREQDWALTRLLDSQRSIRERDFGRERRSTTGEEIADLDSPGALPEGLDDPDRDLREDLLKALERRYPPKYEELIRRYFRSLSDEAPVPDLP